MTRRDSKTNVFHRLESLPLYADAAVAAPLGKPSINQMSRNASSGAFCDLPQQPRSVDHCPSRSFRKRTPRKIGRKGRLGYSATMRPRPASTEPPPTIGHWRGHGLEAIEVCCHAGLCRHAGRIEFDALALPDETPFPEIARRRRFRCTACGARENAVRPDWRDYRAEGRGRAS